PLPASGAGPGSFPAGYSCGASLVRRKKSAATRTATTITSAARTISTCISAHTPGVNGRLSREAGPACLPCSLCCYEARPGVPMPILAGIRAVFAVLHLPGDFAARPGLTAAQLQDPAAGSSRRTSASGSVYAPQVPLCHTAHGGSTGLGPGYEEHTSD